MEPGDKIIQICPHSGRPVLTQVFRGEDNQPKTLCLHKDTVQEEKQDILDWLNEYYDINTHDK